MPVYHVLSNVILPLTVRGKSLTFLNVSLNAIFSPIAVSILCVISTSTSWELKKHHKINDNDVIDTVVCIVVKINNIFVISFFTIVRLRLGCYGSDLKMIEVH